MRTWILLLAELGSPFVVPGIKHRLVAGPGISAAHSAGTDQLPDSRVPGLCPAT